MRALFLTCLIIISSVLVRAQDKNDHISYVSRETIEQPNTVKYYAEIVYTDISAPVNKSIKIDFGINSVLGKRYPAFKDENGKTIRFTTVVDALNFMSSRGWILELEYEDQFIDEGNSYGTIKHFLISKTMVVKSASDVIDKTD